MGRFDKVDVGAIEATAPQGVFFPCVSAVYVCQLNTSGTFKGRKDELIAVKMKVLVSPNRQALLPIPPTPETTLDDGTKIPATLGQPGVEASAVEGQEYTYLRMFGDYPEMVISQMKAMCAAFEGISPKEVTKDHMNAFFDDCERGGAIKHYDEGILFVVTTNPKVSKNGKTYTNHSFSSPNAAQLRQAAANLAAME